MSSFGFFALVYTLNHKKIIAVININFWWSQPCLKQRISDLGILYLVILDQNTEIVLAVKREGFKSLVITFLLILIYPLSTLPVQLEKTECYILYEKYYIKTNLSKKHFSIG